LGRGKVAIDIGANIGNHALYLSDVFQQTHCFEPNPIAVARLRENIALNHIESISVHPIGLSSRDAELPFSFNSEGNLGKSGFVDASSAGTEMLRVVNGDAYLRGLQLPSIDFVKVDVENHELEVFRGLRETIANYRPVITFEYHGGQVRPSTFEQIAECMQGYIFAEALRAPDHLSGVGKAFWNVRHGGELFLHRFERPERRSYENVLGLPDEATFRHFAGLD
jgi:FkbM family methyltransferase